MLPLLLWLLTAAGWAQALPTLHNGDLTIPNLGVAKTMIRDYVKSGRYQEECGLVCEAARAYLEANLKGQGKPAMVLDIDETSLSNWEVIDSHDFGYIVADWSAWVKQAKAKAMPHTLELFRWARAHGVAVFFVTGREESERADTEKNLKAEGYDGWQEMRCFPGGNRVPLSAFKSQERRKIEESGYRIILNMGDQASDLEGGYAEGQFKLPNPMYLVP